MKQISFPSESTIKEIKKLLEKSIAKGMLTLECECYCPKCCLGSRFTNVNDYMNLYIEDKENKSICFFRAEHYIRDYKYRKLQELLK